MKYRHTDCDPKRRITDTGIEPVYQATSLCVALTHFTSGVFIADYTLYHSV